MKHLSTFFALIALSAMSIFAQDETKDQTDKAMQPAQTRLPEDQPKTTTSSSPETTTPAATTESSPSASTGQPNEAELMKQLAEVSKLDRKSTRLNSSHVSESRMPSSA